MTTTDISASLESYNVSSLMTQTRMLAADYREQTGQALPVTEELARFDAINILGLTKIENQDGIDAIERAVQNNIIESSSEVATTEQASHEKYLIKGRVIFKSGKARQKLGKLSLQTEWDNLLMVIYDAQYLPIQIYKVKRKVIDKEMENIATDKRGSMTVAKYKAIGELVWEQPKDNEPERNLQD